MEKYTTPENEYRVYTERWFILLATTVLIFTNIMQWVSFSAQIDQTNMFFCGPDGFHDCSAAFLSNQIYQIVAVIVSIIGMYFATVFGTLPTVIRHFFKLSEIPRRNCRSSMFGSFISPVRSLPYPIAIATLVCMFSAYFVGIIADKTRKFKTIALINALVCAVCVVALRLYLIKVYSGWYDSVIVCTLLSIIMSCCAIHTPIGNEMGVETTYPVQESISTGVLNTFGQAWLFCLYFVMYALQDSNWVYTNSGKGGSWELALDFWAFMSILNFVVALFFLRPRYNRLQMEEEAKRTEEAIRESVSTICKY
ncbi:Protein CBG23387 [Caenorhabditis briggsae]|uniref:Protein CBG23387 n=1 Tax=Caenorhabditis briggsae TaxID=6238 RepID=A8Y415_CAEBR|nr:Protein CBG23387 [Caenorhabditis briggsae]CAP39635.2 Protein CBG23387 [Caenorhabditis briggsae]